MRHFNQEFGVAQHSSSSVHGPLNQGNYIVTCRAAGVCGYHLTPYIYSTIEGKNLLEAAELLAQRFGQDFPQYKFLLLWKRTLLAEKQIVKHH